VTYEITRRSLLFAGAAVGGTALLGGCGSGSTTEPGAAGGPAKRGGTLRAAFVGGGASESLNVFSSGTSMDFVRARALHASLGDLDPSAPNGFRSHVLDAVEPAADLSSYTLRVRPGLRFSDGSPLTARDVAYSLDLAATTAPIGSLAVFAADFDVAGMRVVDGTTLQLPTKRPIADGATILCMGTNFVYREGTKEFTAAMPTSGPFRLVEFDPGRGAKLARNDNFGGSGGPYLDGLELLSIPDGDARLNALRGKQVDYAHDLSPVQARTAQADRSIKVVEAALPSVTSLYFQLNMAKPPFDDPRVRMAFRLAVDRQAILDTVLFGRGRLGNDLLSLGYPDYAADLPQRAHDPAKARDLLRQANAGDLRVTLTTGPETPGMVEAATLYAEHLKEIGVGATLQEKPAGQLYADFAAYSALPFAGGYASATPPMVIYQIIYQGGNPFGFGWNRPDVDQMVLDARAARTADAARAKATTVQRMLADEGNTVVPVFKPSVSAQVPSLMGVEKGLFEQHPSFVEASLR
jgi:peptide/nickel transport system substrate-binding protein